MARRFASDWHDGIRPCYRCRTKLGEPSEIHPKEESSQTRKVLEVSAPVLRITIEIQQCSSFNTERWAAGMSCKCLKKQLMLLPSLPEARRQVVSFKAEQSRPVGPGGAEHQSRKPPRISPCRVRFVYVFSLLLLGSYIYIAPASSHNLPHYRHLVCFLSMLLHGFVTRMMRPGEGPRGVDGSRGADVRARAAW